MANPLQIASKSKLIQEKARLIFNDILNRYKRGEIKSEMDLQYQVYTALDDFFTNIGKPTMQVRKAWGGPVSADYNDTMKEISTDLSVAFSESVAMSKALEESFAQVELERLQMNGQLTQIQDKLNRVKQRMTQKKQETVFLDSFVDKSHLDESMVEGTVAEVNTKEGVLTLSKIEAEEFKEGLTVTILEGDGHPGNTHQVRALNGSLKFFGQDNLHMDLSSIVDGNSDTWFEYESFTVSEAVSSEVNGFGFNYREGMKWVREGGNMRLHIEIELPVGKLTNWLSLSPFLPADKGATPAIIKSILIQDGKGSSNEISNGYEIFREDKVYVFPRQRCKRIIIKLEQEASYETEVGHFFFKELEANTTNYMAKDKEQSGRRVEGDMPSIEKLGYTYDPNNRTLNQPTQEYGITYLKQDEIKSALFNPPKTSGNIQSGVESIKANRYVIGIRDANLSSYRFATASTYLSECYETSEAIREISLESGSMVPTQFGEGDWIKYYISIDDGKTWNEIYTRGTAKPKAKVLYKINENVPIDGRFETVGYIDTLKPIYNVRLKIEISRPSELAESDYYTPVVYDYKLKCVTTKE